MRQLSHFAAIGLFISVMPLGAVTIPQIAGITTIAVNSGAIAKWLRHPKRESKKAGHALKDAVKGKN